MAVIVIYHSGMKGACMRERFCFLVAVIFLFILGGSLAGAQTVTINATPAVVHVGDTVSLRGTVSGIHTIAVYLFVIGPDLDSRGVTLENLNIPAGHGLFTTAPVNMETGTWQYVWDTSVIPGAMNPGEYTVYVVTSPVDHERFNSGGYASADVTFLPPENVPTPAPLPPGIAVAAIVIALTGSLAIRQLKNY
jgi:hypothetical protein